RALHRTAHSVRVKAVELGIALRTAPPRFGARFKIPDQIFVRLQAEAMKRGMKAVALARLILRTFIDRDLWYLLEPQPVPNGPPARPRAPAIRVDRRADPLVPAAVLAERERRYQLEAQRDLTASLMGDPPPRRPHSLGACAVGEPVWLTCNTLPERYLAAHLMGPPQLVGSM